LVVQDGQVSACSIILQLVMSMEYLPSIVEILILSLRNTMNISASKDNRICGSEKLEIR